MLRQASMEKNSRRNISSLDGVKVPHSNPKPLPLFKSFKLKPGLLVTISNRKASDGCRIVHETEEAPISFGCNIRHTVRCTISRSGKKEDTFDRPAGSYVLSSLPKTKCTIEPPPGENILGVSVHFSINTFKTLFNEIPPYFGDLFSTPKKTPYFYHQSKIDPELILVLNQIVRCPYHGEVQRLFLESKSLEVLSLVMHSLENTHRPEQTALNRQDSERIREAYRILAERVDAPLSLCDLSREVGINRNKLNQGFKSIYGKTVFNVLRTLRLYTARDLLLNSKLSILEIALSVGYTNQGNFATAFRRQFGTPPLKVRKETPEECNFSLD